MPLRKLLVYLVWSLFTGLLGAMAFTSALSGFYIIQIGNIAPGPLWLIPAGMIVFFGLPLTSISGKWWGVI